MIRVGQTWESADYWRCGVSNGNLFRVQAVCRPDLWDSEPAYRVRRIHADGTVPFWEDGIYYFTRGAFDGMRLHN